ncbi:MAG TPA: hypothetical protein VMX57_05165, partial [Planctomycetota bacterium]|nr:hypothetical protein [Planctomycetota bacterium]
EEIRKHIDENEIRRVMGMEDPKFDAKWESIRGEIFHNHAVTARAQLMFSFRMMNKDMVKLIVETAARNKKLSDADVHRLVDCAAEAMHWTFHFKRYREFPSLYHAVIGAWSRYKLASLGPRITEWLLTDLGYIDTAAGKRIPNPMIQRLGLGGFDRFVFDTCKKYNRTIGFGARFVRNMTWDIGNVDGIVQVLRATSESNGDPDVIKEAMIRETLYAVPVLGQFLSFARVQTVGEAVQTGALLGAAMYTPAGRYAMVLFSIGEAGVAMYHSDYRAPLANAVADAVYRGFTGPSMYNFGDTPQKFTEADEEELDNVWYTLRGLKYTGSNADEIAGLLAQENRLTEKQRRWKGYVAESSRNEGGWFTGTAAQLRQKPLVLPPHPEFGHQPMHMGGPILARVKPYILFTSSREGPVQFFLPPLTETEVARMGELDTLKDTETNPVTQYEIAEELEKLVVHHEAWKRAQNYLKRARELPELMHQIRVDSLWPYILEDPSHDMVNAMGFVDGWFLFRREVLPPALAAIGIESDWESMRDAKQQLHERLLEDTERSKDRWTKFQNFRKGLEKARQEWYEKAKIRVHVEAMMVAVEEKVNRLSPEVLAALREAGVDVEYAYANEYLSEAIANRHRPVSAPELTITGRVVKGDPDAEDEDDRQHRLYPHVRVVADPSIYIQPWSYAVYQLNHETARKALAAGDYRGLPLDKWMKDGLEQYLKYVEEPEKDETLRPPAFLVYAFCSD